VVEELGSALDQVDMTVGRRIEGAGIDGSHGHGLTTDSSSVGSQFTAQHIHVTGFETGRDPSELRLHILK
jgi:hypothetical protein